ncbi:MAG: DNA polymerase III subunit delta [Bacteroidales bacterium]|nr:DNA polymerase III subunit delta [Bacteroidales bacterium]
MIKYEDLKKQIKQKQFKPVYILAGEEPYFIDRIAEAFENGVIEEENRNFNQIVMYGQETTGTEVVASAKQYPFGSDRLLVIVKEAKSLKEFDAVLNYIKNPTPTTILVICYKYGKITAKQLGKVDSSICEVFSSEPVKSWDVGKWVVSLASEFQYKIDPGTANLIAEHIGDDLSTIYNEFVKMRLVLPPGSNITMDVVQEHIGINKEYNIFELQDALGTRDVAKAYKITLNFTQHLKENPNVKTIAVLYRFFNKMLQYHLAPDKDTATKERIFGSKSSFMINKQVGYTYNYPLLKVVSVMSILREYDMKSKGLGSNASEGDLLKEMIMKILA